MNPETQRTFKVAITLCLICSVIVAALAVGLKGIQEEQKTAYRQQSILKAAGLWKDGADSKELFDQKIQTLAVDLEDNKPEEGDFTSEKFDVEKALRNPELHEELSPADDVAGLKKIEKYPLIYQIKGDDAQVYVLPIRGKGLWSTLYGFIAVDLSEATAGHPEDVKVRGLTYYKDGETPGLGGEVNNPGWQAKWPGRRIYDGNGDVQLQVSKRVVDEYQVDALSGATLTSNGVTNMLKFWLGDHGFGPFLKSLISANPASATTAAVGAKEQHPQ
ncbi:MAG: Na(+)-translocating NADH-quinone reductase subunit C [Planctomycetaceae bacterium]